MTQRKRTRQRLLPLSPAISTLALAGALMAAPMAQAGFDNGGFENDLTNWTTSAYNRKAASSSQIGITNFPPTKFDDLTLTLTTDRSAQAEIVTTFTDAGVTGPRWGDKALKLGGSGGRQASSIEQTATMTVADIDPTDGKIHIRFALAPILNNPSHKKENQPFFFVEVYNVTKQEQLFHTFNFSNQSGIPWQSGGGGKQFTDWQGFDISPGNGLLDVGDEVTLKIYTSNCSEGAGDHDAVVYVDAVGAFMPGLSVQATGPSNALPNDEITYNYNYTNGSGVYALGTEVEITAPFTANGLPLTFVENEIPDNCAGPETHDPAARGQYIVCDVGDLANNQGGSLPVQFKVPSDASSTSPDNVINNGDYNVYASSVSPYLGPLVKTNIHGSGTELVDLGVTIDNGGKASYTNGEEVTYTVTVKNHGDQQTAGTVTQTITGMGDDCNALTLTDGATCATGGTDEVTITFDTGDLNDGQETSYTIKGTPTSSPVNTVASVAPAGAAVDSNQSNNTAGMNTPMGSTHDLTVNTTGVGHVLSTEPTLACGDVNTACDSTGKTQKVAEDHEVRFTPVPHDGYMFKDWTGCDDVEGTVCVTTMVDDDKTVTANFVPAVIVTPKIDPKNPGGSITEGPTQVETGTHTPPTFSIIPNEGKVPVLTGNSCEGTIGEDNGDYFYTPGTPVSGDCDFTVAFVGPHITTVVTPPNGPLVPGEEVYTSVTCISDGAVTAQGVTCGMTPPSGVTGWEKVSCSPNDPVNTDLAVGESAECLYKFIVPPTGPVTLTGNGTCTADGCEDEDKKIVKLPHTPVPGVPHITTVVTPPEGPLVPGETVTTTVTCTSDGGATAEGVTCTIDQPNDVEDWEVESCTPEQPATLPVGQSAQCTYTFKVPEDPDNPGQPLNPGPVELNGNGSCNGAECGSNDETETPAPKVPGPHITTVVTPPANPVPGKTVTTTVTCTSDGDVAAPNATCGLVSPTGVEEFVFLGCEPESPQGSLAVNHEMVCTYEFSIPKGVTDVPLTGVGNCAASSCGSQNEKRITPLALPNATPVPVPVDNPFALLLLALGLLGLGSRYARQRNAA